MTKEKERLTPRQFLGVVLIMIGVVCLLALLNGLFPEREKEVATTLSLGVACLLFIFVYLIVLGSAKAGSRKAKKILVKLRF